MTRTFGKFLSGFIIMILLASFWGKQPAYAAGSIIVNTNADNTTNDGLCTLREAIQAANSNADVNGADDCDYTGSGDPDSITFTSNFTITLLGSQLPVITTPITITGKGAANTIIQAGSTSNSVSYRVFEVSSTGSLTLDGITVQNGRCVFSCATNGDKGGGILNVGGTLTIKNSTISANIAGAHGGGIYNDSGTLTVTNSTFSDNSAALNISNVGDGGGIDNVMGTITITDSTFTGNEAAFGGGISNNSGFISCTGTPSATITNSTFSGNSAFVGAGGIFNLQGTIVLNFNTITSNSSGGVGSMNTGSTCTKVGGNIIFGNTGSDVLAANSGTTQRFVSLGYNLVGVAGANVDFTQELNAIGDLTGASHNPNLGPLTNNGGFTETHALLTGSDAIDASTNCVATDQRGVTRPQGAACDIGAYELDSTSPTVLSYTVQASYTGTGPSTFTVTFSEDVSNAGGDSLTDDVTNPNNYKIINKGANGTVDTASCASAVGGDDTLIIPSGVTYVPNTAIVNIGSALPNGNYRLFVCGTTSIVDLAGNALAGDGITPNTDFTFDFTVDTTAPSVVSSVRTNANPTNAASVDFTVTFSEPVTGVDINDFTLTTSGLTGASVSAVSGSGASYTVTASTGYKPGTLRLDIPASASITDLVGNAINSLPFTSGETYTVNKNPTFADVPFDHWAWQYIESIYQAGITGGCGSNPLSYCPTQAVTRAQMAVFLLKGIHGSSYTPPAVGASTGFTDVATDYWAAAWIKQLAAEGITGGCGTGIYCPENTVTRDQMAVFLLRAEHGSAYTPPAVGASTGFTDVPVDYWAAAWIKQLAAEAITGGCGSGVYCPTNPVTRDQMAVFLQKTFGLPLP